MLDKSINVTTGLYYLSEQVRGAELSPLLFGVVRSSLGSSVIATCWSPLTASYDTRQSQCSVVYRWTSVGTELFQQWRSVTSWFACGSAFSCSAQYQRQLNLVLWWDSSRSSPTRPEIFYVPLLQHPRLPSKWRRRRNAAGCVHTVLPFVLAGSTSNTGRHAVKCFSIHRPLLNFNRTANTTRFAHVYVTLRCSCTVLN